MAEEYKSKADKVLLAAAKKLLYSQPYEARFMAISHHYATKKKENMPKSKARKGNVTLTREEYLAVSNLFFLFLIGAKFHYMFLKCYVFII